MRNAILPTIMLIAALLSPLYAQNPRGSLRSLLTRSRRLRMILIFEAYDMRAASRVYWALS